MPVPANDILRTPWLWEAKPFRIADNLYYVGDKDVSVHMVDTGEGLLLLDTGYPGATYLLLESIRTLGYAPCDIKWILHSHGHIDHFGSTRILVEKYDCKTYFPKIDLPLLNERADLNWCEEFGLPFEPPYDTWFSPDVLVSPGDVLTFGNTKVEVFAAGGHTPGTVAYRFTLPSGLKAAMHGGVGVNTMASAYSRKRNLGTAWRDAFLRDICDLYDLEVDIVLGNHPNQSNTFQKLAAMTEETNPFIDPTEWNRFLADREKIFRDMCRRDPLE